MKNCRGGQRIRRCKAAEQKGWDSAVPSVWAAGLGQKDIAFGLPGDDLTLLFHCPAVADSAYTKLVSRPGLSAFVTIDKSTHWFLGVRFRHNRQG
jgi:hypothetical protein